MWEKNTKPIPLRHINKLQKILNFPEAAIPQLIDLILPFPDLNENIPEYKKAGRLLSYYIDLLSAHNSEDITRPEFAEKAYISFSLLKACIKGHDAIHERHIKNIVNALPFLTEENANILIEQINCSNAAIRKRNQELLKNEPDGFIDLPEQQRAGALLSWHIKRDGLTETQFAKRMDISLEELNKITSGKKPITLESDASTKTTFDAIVSHLPDLAEKEESKEFFREEIIAHNMLVAKKTMQPRSTQLGAVEKVKQSTFAQSKLRNSQSYYRT